LIYVSTIIFEAISTITHVYDASMSRERV